ncbi:MAG: glycosyltransferase [Leptospirales bacterium]
MIPVLYLIEHLRQGGSERYVAELARSASAMGVRPHVGCFSAGGIFYDEVQGEGIPVTVFPLKSLYHPSVLGVAFRIARTIRKEGIRIIHTFQPNANVLGTLVGRTLGVPVVISRRNLGDFGGLGSPRLAWLQRHLTNGWSSRVLANSRAVRQAAIVGEGFPAEKVALIYNGLDTKRFTPCPDPSPLRFRLGIPETAFVFGIASGFRPVKGVDFMIRAFARAYPDCQGSILVIAGDGPERVLLKSLVHSLGLDAQVRFLGVRSDMESVYPVFDVFVLCSHSEGFSNAILEAMGMGIPVIASEVGGNIEMVSDGVQGYLVAPGDEKSLADRMIRLYSDPESARAMGHECRSWVERTNDRSIVQRQLANLYQEILRA